MFRGGVSTRVVRSPPVYSHVAFACQKTFTLYADFERTIEHNQEINNILIPAPGRIILVIEYDVRATSVGEF